jgi:hypothetical protein
MIYIKSLIAGALASVSAFIIYAVLVTARYRGQGMVGINLAAPLSLAIIVLAFIAVFYLTFRFSK